MVMAMSLSTLSTFLKSNYVYLADWMPVKTTIYGKNMEKYKDVRRSAEWFH